MCATPSCDSPVNRIQLSRRWLFLAVLFIYSITSLRAADLATARQQLISGDYTNCVTTCEQAIANFEYEEEWRVLLVRSLVAIGKYPEAGTVISNALDRYSWSIPLRLLAHEVLPFTGETNRSQEVLRQIETLVSSR